MSMVSVIIPNWNGKKFLKKCLDSLLSQTYQDIEIILVDNASTDRSIEFINASYPDVKAVQLDINRGFCGAANEGIKIAKGEFVAMVNNDVITDPHWLEELVHGMELSGQIGICASKILRLSNEAEIDTAGDGYTRYGVAVKRGQNGNGDIHAQRQFVFGACAAAALYRKSMLDEIGCFDEDLFCIYEDVDLSFRAQLAGFQCLYVPTAVVYHLVGGTAGTNNDFTLYYGQRNLESVFFKNMPLKPLMKYLPLHLGYNCIAFFYHVFQRKGRLFLRSKVDALKRLESILQKRKVIQRKKRVSSHYLEALFDRRSVLRHKAKAG